MKHPTWLTTGDFTEADEPLRLFAAWFEEATRGRKMTASERELLKARLGQEKYQRLLQELLASLRERSTVRILDPLDEGQVAEKGR